MAASVNHSKNKEGSNSTITER